MWLFPLTQVADWTGQTYSDKRLANKYNTQFGGGGQYAYYQDDEEGSYQLVDTSRGGTRVTRSRFRIGQRNVRNRQTGGRNQMQVLNKGGRNNRSQPQSQQRGKWQKNASRNKYDAKGQVKKRDTSASVAIKSSWRVIEEMDFLRLSKLSLPNVGDGKDVKKCGSLEYYDKQYDRVTCRNEKRLQRMNRVSYTVTTTDDPIIRQLSKTMGQVYATDAIISTLMCATRSVSSWDIVVQRVDNKLFFDKREDSNFDLLTVNETAAEPPYVDDEGKNSINSPQNLALEATYINFNFSQQVLKLDEKGQRFSFEHPNPFAKEEDAGEPASVAYRYRKFDLLNFELIVRTEVGAATFGPSNEIQFMNIKGLNEWDPKASGGINWREKLDVQRGAVLANELKNNSCKLAKWTVQSLLAAADQLKFGYISRVTSRDSSKHAILGTQQVCYSFP
jgi:translation initiation factor 3 subunit D